MNKKLAFEWADALESGKYRQGKHVLRYGENYCCLGVLCELLGIPSRPHVDKTQTYSYGVENRISVLPEEALKKAGLKSADGAFNEETGIPMLVIQNDLGNSFALIAAVIRKHYKDLV